MKLTKSKLKQLVREELNKHQADIFNESSDVGFVGRMFGKKSKLATQLMQQIADLKLDDDTSNWIESGDSSTPEWREKADKLYDLSIQARTILKPSRLGDGLQKKQARTSFIEIEELSDRAEAVLAGENGDPGNFGDVEVEEVEPEEEDTSPYPADPAKVEPEKYGTWEGGDMRYRKKGDYRDYRSRGYGAVGVVPKGDPYGGSLSMDDLGESKKLTKHTLTRILKEELKNL